MTAKYFDSFYKYIQYCTLIKLLAITEHSQYLLPSRYHYLSFISSWSLLLLIHTTFSIYKRNTTVKSSNKSFYQLKYYMVGMRNEAQAESGGRVVTPLEEERFKHFGTITTPYITITHKDNFLLINFLLLLQKFSQENSGIKQYKGSGVHQV